MDVHSFANHLWSPIQFSTIYIFLVAIAMIITSQFRSKHAFFGRL